MTKTGHNVVGFCCAAGALAFPLEHPWFMVLGVWLGATAPDWLEIAWYSPSQRRRMSIIEHRTWTHWLLPWIVLLVFSLLKAQVDIGYWILFGFAVGGIAHLIVDLPNPTGVPIITPFRRSRKSLNWWRSGEMEWFIAMIFAAAATLIHVYTGHYKIIFANPGWKTVASWFFR